jgi:hypothetical protein
MRSSVTAPGRQRQLLRDERRRPGVRSADRPVLGSGLQIVRCWGQVCKSPVLGSGLQTLRLAVRSQSACTTAQVRERSDLLKTQEN